MNKTILVVGGDIRFSYLADILRSREGFNVITLAQDDEVLSIETKMDIADIVILPLPLSFDEQNLNAPFYPEKIHLSELITHLKPNHTLLTGGKLPKEFKTGICNVYDYTNSEDFLQKNARLTAEGLIKIAIEELPLALNNSEIAITGYGRIGKYTSKMLNNFGTNTTVFARNVMDRNKARHEGLIAFDYSDFQRLGNSFDCIINTVPIGILDEAKLKALRHDCLLIEAASSPFGIDFKSADKRGLKTIVARSLPGKVSPKSAALAISDSIMKLIEGG